MSHRTSSLTVHLARARRPVKSIVKKKAAPKRGLEKFHAIMAGNSSILKLTESFEETYEQESVNDDARNVLRRIA